MIVFDRVEVTDFGSYYGTHNLALNREAVVLVEGDNGAGKSTMFDALTWALYGVTSPRRGGSGRSGGISGDDVKPTGMRKARTQVRVEFRDTRKACAYVVSRTRIDRPALTLTKIEHGERVDLTASDMVATQAVIDGVLGMGYGIWNRSVVFGQSDLFDFCDATDAQRVAVLTEMFDLQRLDYWQDRAKAIRREAENEVSSARGAMQRLDVTKPASQDSLKKAHAEWEASRTKKIDRLREMIENAEGASNVKALDEALDAAAAEAEGIVDNEVPAPDTTALEAVRSDLAGCREAYKAALAKARGAEASLKEMERAVEAGVCPTCKQATPSPLEGELSGLQSLYEAAQTKLHELGDRGKELRAAAEELEEGLQAASKARAEWEEAMGVASAAVRKAQTDYDAAQSEAAMTKVFEDQIADLEDEVNPFDGQIETAKADEERWADEYQAAKDELAAAESTEAAAFVLEKALGMKGVRASILGTIVGKMATETNRWLSILSGGRMWVEYATKVQTKTRGEKPGFAVNVFAQDGPVTIQRPYRQWSGGERRRVSMACELALAHLVGTRGDSPHSLVVMDEVFRGLDTEGRKAALEAMLSDPTPNRTIFVIDHDQEFKGLFTEVIRVEKGPKGSQIEDGQQRGS